MGFRYGSASTDVAECALSASNDVLDLAVFEGGRRNSIAIASWWTL